MSGLLQIADEVRDAIEMGAPVVALESTIIAHGFPYPSNIECARNVERIVREEGATPATIAIVDGVARVGLSESELERLATEQGVAKVSRRDVAVLVALGRTGATTVAATMMIAKMAGIRVFATGGIGGVHRGAAASFDISADLLELARTRVAVVCAGAKSVLDIGLTLEHLETHGVPVLGYRTSEFPAFYTRSSGHPVDFRLDDPESVARVLRVRDELGLDGGEVIANPIDPADEIPAEEIEAVISAAIVEAASSGVTGKALTPFLLNRIHERTARQSERANKALVYSNARLAARIARAYHRR